MLVQQLEVIIVNKINFPFTYKPLKGGRKVYAKDYNTEDPYTINKDKLKEVPYSTGRTILIKYNNKLFWCPQFEDFYKSYKGIKSYKDDLQRLFVTRANLQLRTTYPTLTFKFKNQEYITNDVKQILIKDANN